MRGRIGVLMNPSGIGRTSKLISRASFSSSSDGSGGRGRGRGVSAPNFVAGIVNDNASGHGRGHEHGHGHGQGRGNPLPSSPFLPSFVAHEPNPPPEQPILGRGRGSGVGVPGNEMGTSSEAQFVESVPPQPIGEKNLPENLLNDTTALTGTGRGKPVRNLSSPEKVKEENRHLKPRRVGASATAATGDGGGADRVSRPKLSREEAVKKAVGVLSRNVDGSGGPRRRFNRRKNDEDDDDDEGGESEEEDRLFGVGNDADGEKFAKKLGPSLMAEFSEALDGLLERRLPEVGKGEDDFLDAYDTNLKIELEPEFLMGDFETNPDIDENPPIPLREALEKMKPFLMAYEGIQDQEEWEKIIQDTMDSAPQMKKVVDHYCGPDRVTAKQQHAELERVANTLPVSAPNSVKSFTDRAVLSLQSNPGWGFHRKRQFMNKLVKEFSKSKSYK